MRCRPGDLAVIIGSLEPRNIGGLVRVLDDFHADPGDWRVLTLTWLRTTTRLNSMSGIDLQPGSIGYIEDRCLRPLRDPGDAAVDEMVQLLGAAPKSPGAPILSRKVAP